jgi:hypothetical protein
MRIGLAVLALLWSVLAYSAPKADLWPYWQTEAAQSQITVDHARWQRLLDTYLDAEHASGIHRFDYAAVTEADQSTLDSYLQALQKIDPRQLSRAEQQAYWINLYNAHTVQLVLQAYPVKSILKVQGGIFGRGPWNKTTLRINGLALSLNDVEHRILRPIWQDHRIHFAVNCASLGCPNLLPEVFTAANTENLLNRAAKDYLAHSRGLRWHSSTLHLSKIFDWYQDDFGRNESELLRTLASHLSPAQAKRLETFSGDIEYHYDWALNQPE